MNHRRDAEGRHVFSDGRREVSFEHALEDRHVRFLRRNPAAVRVCGVQGLFDLPWLDHLMTRVAHIDASGLRTLQ